MGGERGIEIPGIKSYCLGAVPDAFVVYTVTARWPWCSGYVFSGCLIQPTTTEESREDLHPMTHILSECTGLLYNY
jgi:hypothetical protein